MMNNANIGGCAAKLFWLLVGLIILTAACLFVVRESNGTGQAGKPNQAQVKNGPLKMDQAKHPAGQAELKELLQPADLVRKDSGTLAGASTRVNQLVLWQIDDNKIYFRIILTPYDKNAHQMMMTPSEALFVSFETKAGERIAPQAEPLRIEMRTLRIATEDGAPAGWFLDGNVPLADREEREIAVARVGWLFSKRLHSRLRQLQP